MPNVAQLSCQARGNVGWGSSPATDEHVRLLKNHPYLKADLVVGRGPRGPPYKTKWHWQSCRRADLHVGLS